MKTFKFDLGTDKFVGDYYNEIVSIINKYNYIKIIAPTECGKTEFVKRFAYNNKVNIIQPTNAICINKFKDNYYEKYFERYNSEPKLKSIRIIGTETGIFELADEVSNVMVVDQAIKHFKEFENSIVFLDECHSVNDGTYRKSYLSFIQQLRGLKCKLITMTGTPNDEEGFLGEPDAIIIMKTTNNITVDILPCITNQVGVTLKQIIKTQNYSHFMIYSNRYFGTIKTNIKEYYPVLIHNKYKGKTSTKEWTDIVEKGVIKDYPVVLFTKLMNAGVDIRYDAPTHIICAVEDDSIDPSEIIQAFGRIRKRGIDTAKVHFTVLVAKPFERNTENTLSSEETMFIKNSFSEFDFLGLKLENYMELADDKIVINEDYYTMVLKMRNNTKKNVSDLITRLQFQGFSVRILPRVLVNENIKDVKADNTKDIELFTNNAETITSILDNEQYYNYFETTEEEPRIEDNIVYCNDKMYVRKCASVYKRIMNKVGNKLDLGKCGTLSLDKLEEINLFIKLFKGKNFDKFKTITEEQFVRTYIKDPKKEVLNNLFRKLWTRIKNYQKIYEKYQLEEITLSSPINDLFEFIPFAFEDEKMTTIMKKDAGSKGGKIGGSKGGKIGGAKKGKTNNTKKCIIRYNGCPVMECDSKKEAAEILNVNSVSLTKDETKLNLELGCFCWETLDPELRTTMLLG